MLVTFKLCLTHYPHTPNFFLANLETQPLCGIFRAPAIFPKRRLMRKYFFVPKALIRGLALKWKQKIYFDILTQGKFFSKCFETLGGRFLQNAD